MRNAGQQTDLEHGRRWAGRRGERSDGTTSSFSPSFPPRGYFHPAVLQLVFTFLVSRRTRRQVRFPLTQPKQEHTAITFFSSFALFFFLSFSLSTRPLARDIRSCSRADHSMVFPWLPLATRSPFNVTKDPAFNTHITCPLSFARSIARGPTPRMSPAANYSSAVEKCFFLRITSPVHWRPLAGPRNPLSTSLDDVRSRVRSGNREEGCSTLPSPKPMVKRNNGALSRRVVVRVSSVVFLNSVGSSYFRILRKTHPDSRSNENLPRSWRGILKRRERKRKESPTGI